MILVEAAEDARRVAGLAPSSGQEVLALTAEAAHELATLGVPHTVDAELVSDAVFQDVTARTLTSAEHLAADLDRLAPAPGGEPAWGHAVLELKRMLDKYLGAAAVLAKAAERLEASELAFFAGPGPEPSPSMELGRGSMWQPVVPAVAHALGVDAHVLGERDTSPYGLRVERPWQRSSGLPRRVAAALRARRRFRRTVGESPRGGEGTLLALTVASGIVAEVMAEGAREGLRVVRWEGRGRPTALTGPPRLLSAERVAPERVADARAWAADVRAQLGSGTWDVAIGAAASAGGIDLTEPVTERLRMFAAGSLAEVAVADGRAAATLDALGTRVLLHSGAEYWWHRAVVRAARSHRVPVVAVQHGGGQGYVDDRSAMLRRESELRGTDLYVAWARGVVEDYCGSVEPPVRGFVREPASLRAIHSARERTPGPASRTLLMVPTNMTGNRRRGPATEPRDTDHHLLQRRIAAAALASRDWRVMIKSSPGGLAADPPASTDPRVTITNSGTLTEHAADAAAIVVLWPFTVLLEALATARPVLCVCDEATVALRPEARDLLERRADVITGFDRLEERVGAFLARAEDPQAELDDSFLRRYGLGGTDESGWLAQALAAPPAEA